MPSNQALAMTRTALVTAGLLALAACAQLYPFRYTELTQGPFTVGPEWTEIQCPGGIETSLPKKQLFLRLQRKATVPDYREKVVVVGDQRIHVEAEVVGADQRVYALSEWKQLSVIAGRGGINVTLTHPDFPRTLRITTVRLRSSSPVTFDEVLWTSSREPGPPR